MSQICKDRYVFFFDCSEEADRGIDHSDFSGQNPEVWESLGKDSQRPILREDFGQFQVSSQSGIWTKSVRYQLYIAAETGEKDSEMSSLGYGKAQFISICEQF